MTGAAWLDPVAGFIIAIFAINEGREAGTANWSTRTDWCNMTRLALSVDGGADLWMNEGIQTDINPGNQVNVKVAFDVPNGTQPSEIELHDSAFSGGVTVRLS